MSEETKQETCDPGVIALTDSQSTQEAFPTVELSPSSGSSELSTNQLTFGDLESCTEHNDPHRHCKQQLERLKQEHKAELKRTSFEIEELSKQNAGLEEQVRVIKGEAFQEQTDLKRKLEEKDWKLEALIRELVASKDVADELRKEKKRLESEIQALKHDLLPSHNLQDNTHNPTGDVQTQPEFMQLLKDNENLKLELKRVQTENKTLKVERSEPLELDHLQDVKTEKENLQREMNLTTNKLLSVEESYQKSLDKLRALEREAVDYRDKISTLEAQLIDNKISSEQLTDLKEEIKTYDEEKEELKKEIASQNSKIQELEALLSECESKKHSMAVSQDHMSQADHSSGEGKPVIYKEICTTVIEEVDDGSIARLDSMLDLALKKNKTLELELQKAQEKLALVEEKIKEMELLRVTNTEHESEIRLYKTRLQSMESRAHGCPENETVDELRRTKIEKEVENENLKQQLNMLNEKYKEMERRSEEAKDQMEELEYKVKRINHQEELASTCGDNGTAIRFAEQGNEEVVLPLDKFVTEMKVTFERQVVSLQHALSASHEHCERLQTEQRHLKDEISLLKDMKRENEVATKANDDKQHELLQTLKSAEQEILKWKKLYEAVQGVKTQQESELKDLKEQVAVYEIKVAENESYYQKESQLQKDVFNANIEVSKWKGQWEMANSNRVKLEQEVTRLKSQVEELKKVNAETDFDLKAFDDQKSSLQLELAKSAETNSRLEKHVEHTLARLSATEEQMKTIRHQLQEYQMLVQKGKDITASLEITLQYLRVENGDLEKLVTSLREELRLAKGSPSTDLCVEEKEQDMELIKSCKRSSEKNDKAEVVETKNESNSLKETNVSTETTDILVKEVGEDSEYKETVLKENYTLSLELHSCREKTLHLENHVKNIVDERDHLREQIIENVTKLKENEQTIKDMKQKIKELENEVENLQQKVGMFELGQHEPWKTSMTTSEVKTREEMIKTLQAENLKAKEKLSALELKLKESKEIDVASVEVRIREDKIRNLEYQIKTLQREKQDLESQLKKTFVTTNVNSNDWKDETIKNLQFQLQKLQERNSLLELKLTNYHPTAATMSNDGISQPKDSNPFNTKEKDQQLNRYLVLAESQFLHSEMSREECYKIPLKDTRISSLELENKMLNEKVATLEMRLHEFRKKEDRSVEIPLKEARISSLDFENSYLKERVNTLEIQLLDARKELNTFRIQLVTYKGHHDLNSSQLSENSSRSQDGAAPYNVILEEKQRKITKLEAEVQTLKSKIHVLESSAKQWNTQSEKDTLIMSLENQISELKEKRKILENKLSSTTQEDDNCIKVKLRLADFDNKLLKEKNESLKEQVDAYFRELVQLRSNERSLHMKVDEFEKMKQRNEENEALIAELEEVKQALENKIFSSRMGHENASETRTRMLECENKFLREKTEAVEKQREAKLKELKEKENIILQITFDKKLLVERMSEYERQINHLEEKNKFFDNMLSGIQHDSEGLFEVRIKNLELDNKYLQERNDAIVVQREESYRELRHNEDIICQLKSEKKIDALKIAEYENVRRKKEECEIENEKLREERHLCEREIYSLNDQVAFLESQLKDVSFELNRKENYRRELQEKDAVIKELHENENALAEKIKKMSLKAEEEKGVTDEQTEKDNLIIYLRDQTYALRDEIDRIKNQEYSVESLSDTNKEKDELIEYLREETYSLRTEVVKLKEDLAMQNKMSTMGDSESSTFDDELVTKEKENLMKKQFKGVVEDGEMLKELENEIFALRDENDYYKRMFADKNNVVTDLRLNIADCHKEIEHLKEKLQSAEHRGQDRSSNGCNEIEKMFKQAGKGSTRREDQALIQDGENVPYSYNVDPTNRARDGRSSQREEQVGHVEETNSSQSFSEKNFEKTADLNTSSPAPESKDAEDELQISSKNNLKFTVKDPRSLQNPTQRISQKCAGDSVDEDGKSVTSKEEITEGSQIPSQITTSSSEVSVLRQATDSTPSKETHSETAPRSHLRRSRHYEEFLERQRQRRNKTLDRDSRVSNPYSFLKCRDFKSYKYQFMNRNEQHPFEETKN